MGKVVILSSTTLISLTTRITAVVINTILGWVASYFFLWAQLNLVWLEFAKEQFRNYVVRAKRTAFFLVLWFIVLYLIFTELETICSERWWIPFLYSGSVWMGALGKLILLWMSLIHFSEAGLDNLQRSLPTQIIVSFYDCHSLVHNEYSYPFSPTRQLMNSYSISYLYHYDMHKDITSLKSIYHMKLLFKPDKTELVLKSQGKEDYLCSGLGYMSSNF